MAVDNPYEREPQPAPVAPTDYEKLLYELVRWHNENVDEIVAEAAQINAAELLDPQDPEARAARARQIELFKKRQDWVLGFEAILTTATEAIRGENIDYPPDFADLGEAPPDVANE